MKISYSEDGSILSAAIDTEALSGDLQANVEDNQDLLVNPGKYEYDPQASTVSIRRHLHIIPAGDGYEETVGQPWGFTVEARLPDGSVDQSCTATATASLCDESGQSWPIDISNGVGSHSSYVMESPGQAAIVVTCEGYYQASAVVIFSQ